MPVLLLEEHGRGHTVKRGRLPPAPGLRQLQTARTPQGLLPPPAPVVQPPLEPRAVWRWGGRSPWVPSMEQQSSLTGIFRCGHGCGGRAQHSKDGACAPAAQEEDPTREKWRLSLQYPPQSHMPQCASQGSACQRVSTCAVPVRGHLGFRQPPSHPEGRGRHCFSQPDAGGSSSSRPPCSGLRSLDPWGEAP